jgi:hypothetical protein
MHRFIKKISKRLLFFWLVSFLGAIGLYYLFLLIVPGNHVFGVLNRMFVYHWEHPVQYILIACLFYGIVATTFADSFAKQNIPEEYY